MSFAFTFDASACSGCKACQVACKDKNNLPPGVLWRRVYEITGGSWQQMGPAWVTDVFAYNLTIACNHCVHPKCAGVCPTDAFVTREDGIVYIDGSKCMGCGYCSWACPYVAPRYHPESGVMTKCDFCYDNIDAGLPPACVAACPLRVLDYMYIPPLPIGEGQGVRVLWELPARDHPFPLPKFSRTEPHLAIKPHAAMANTLEKTVSNREEIKPGKAKSELPLAIFTLLGQMAAGMAVLSFFSGPLPFQLLITLGVLTSLAGLASLFHLGSPLNAWRAIVHLKKSWLSREILMFGLFGASWLLCLAMPGMGKLPLALAGIGLVFSMAQVYRLRAIPAWNSNRTLLSFAGSALLLGGLGLKAIAISTNSPSFGGLSNVLIAVIGLILAFSLSLSEREQAHQTARKLRLGLIALAIIGMLGMIFSPDMLASWIVSPILIICLFEEGIGRWLFYEPLHQRNL